MKRETLAIADIYVPVKRRARLEQKRVDEIAASMLDKGQQTPILVRADRPGSVLARPPEGNFDIQLSSVTTMRQTRGSKLRTGIVGTVRLNEAPPRQLSLTGRKQELYGD